MSGTIWTKFFWSDWETEPALRLCSYAAQGLWMRMLCIASAHDPIGYVAVAGRALDETSIARMTGGSESEVRDLLGELDRNGVFSRDRQGRIFSRRMVKDARRAAIARKNGKKGGNPNLGNNGGNIEGVNPPDNRGLKPQEPSANFQTKEDANASLVAGGDAKAAFDEWNALAKRLSLPVAKDLTPARRKAINARLATAGMAGWREALAAVEASSHCRGENDRAWRADLDFVATPSKFAKLREGSYGPVSSAATAPPAAVFDGPPEIRTWAAERLTEGYARSYIDPSGWDAGNRALLAANPFAEGRLKRDLAEICDRWKFTVRQGEVSAPVPSNDLFQQGVA